jgi:PAS domain S-box-containing protein
MAAQDVNRGKIRTLLQRVSMVRRRAQSHPAGSTSRGNTLSPSMQAVIERQRAEEMLRESQQHYRRLADLFPGLVGVQAQDRLVSVNSAGLDLLGAASQAELMGRPIADLVHPDSRPVIADQIRRVMDQGAETNPVEQKWTRLDGALIYVRVVIVPFTHEGRPAVQIVASDLSPYKRAEAALRESQERHRRFVELSLDLIGVETARTAELHAARRRAEEADQLKSRLLSTVSHELRTPLTSIRGQITTLLDYADHIGPQERLEILRLADSEAARLDELLSHLLDMSRLEAGMLRVEAVATDLRPVLDEAVTLCAAQAPHHRIVTDLPPELPLAQADRRRVMQVMGNLLGNAVKFSPPGTTVTVRAQVHPATVVIHVSDQGVGISQEHLPFIFDRFYRVEDSGVRTSGQGLGLAICRGLVEAMGGQVAVESRVGQGSTFSFSLMRTQGVNHGDIHAHSGH